MFQPTSLLCLLLLFSCGAIAQTPAPRTDKPVPATEINSAKEAQARVRRGLEILIDAGNEAARLDDQEIAARLLVRIADLIWKREPQVASDFTRKAYEKALDHLQDGKLRVTASAAHRDFYQRYLLCRTVITLAK